MDSTKADYGIDDVPADDQWLTPQAKWERALEDDMIDALTESMEEVSARDEAQVVIRTLRERGWSFRRD